jgi:uncharacterized protein YbjT (DUF2867 family)
MTEEQRDLDIVTGAYGFTGKYIARRLLARGRRIRTLTGHPQREHPFGESVPAALCSFDDPAALAAAMDGAATLYNTYWVRFEKGKTTFAKAVDNTRTLLQAATAAGVRRVVHISVAQADEDSPYPAIRAKAAAERVVRESGLSFAIIRPTAMFGAESALFNNMAWMLRRFPLFPIPGNGKYRLQPVGVDDVAARAIELGSVNEAWTGTLAGPEVFTYEEIVRMVAKAVGSRSRIIHVGPERFLHLSKIVAGMVHDVLLTREEIEILTRDLLIPEAPVLAPTRLSDWLVRCGADLGGSYISELQHHYQ